ncbi:hypothetical protein O7A70_31705 [Mesorhizobium sp. Cs1299R1N1]|uniref:hypothetical protein n=1 Tax=Mesorhizobium sp. Cs1299R1N1 TaxID=3015172 RepID=UPI00301D0A8E
MTKLLKLNDADFVVEIPPQFEKYVDTAMLRLQVLYPACRLTREGNAISIGPSDSVAEDQLRRDVLHTIFREKVYAETLVMRQALVTAVMRR